MNESIQIFFLLFDFFLLSLKSSKTFKTNQTPPYDYTYHFILQHFYGGIKSKISNILLTNIIFE